MQQQRLHDSGSGGSSGSSSSLASTCLGRHAPNVPSPCGVPCRRYDLKALGESVANTVLGETCRAVA